MQLMTMSCALLVASLLTGCGSSSTESQSDKVEKIPKAQLVNQDLLSIDGELFPLSAYYGVCTTYKGIWRTTFHSGPLNPHEPTGGEITAAGGINLKISVGKFSLLPGAVLKDIPETSSQRRIQLGHDRFDSFVLVSEFENAGSNRVSIGYDEKDADAEAAAISLANNIVACHVSAVPAKAVGKR